jgi:spermidine synthase
VSARFEELDWRRTPLGELVLRRRRNPVTDRDVYEVKLDDDFLMSSMFTAAEEEMGRLALAGSTASTLDVVVGGLGLGYTARTVLEHPHVRSLIVIEALGEVIEWHERHLVPNGPILTSDARCHLVRGDFFSMLDSPAGLDPTAPGRQFDAIVVDIDHSPRHLLHPSHAAFYEPTGIQRVAELLHPGGVFTLWSNDPPDEEFCSVLSDVFAEVKAEIVTFGNPLQERDAANTIYLGNVGSEQHHQP